MSIKIVDLHEEDIANLCNLIPVFLEENKDKLTAKEGFALGVISFQISFYGILVKAEQRGEVLSENDTYIKNKIATLIENIEGLEEFLVDRWARYLQKYKDDNPELYEEFVANRGKHLNNYKENYERN